MPILDSFTCELFVGNVLKIFRFTQPQIVRTCFCGEVPIFPPFFRGFPQAVCGKPSLRFHLNAILNIVNPFAKFWVVFHALFNGLTGVNDRTVVAPAKM